MEYVFYLQIKRGNITMDDVLINKRKTVQTLLDADAQNQ